MLKKKLPTLLLLAILLGSTLLSTGCGIKRLPPAPVVGVDISAVKKGEAAPFDGTLFSPFYLNNYLQWKEDTKR